MAQASPKPFTKQDATAARCSYQHLAAVINRLLNRIMQGLDHDAQAAFKPSVFHTVHALHGFFHGRNLTKKDVVVAHKFVTPYFDYTGHEDNAAKFMDRRLDALLEAEYAAGRRFIDIQRADGETLLFTWYKSHPLLDAAEELYLKARQKSDYWKCAAAAVTDAMLDEAIASLPVCERPAPAAKPELETECGHPAGSGECDGCEQWEAAETMKGRVLKGRWTKVHNNVIQLLTDEFDAGTDPELVAAREAAKIIKAGKDIKIRLARERLRSAMALRSVEEIDDDAPARSAEVIHHPSSRRRDTGETGKDSVPSGGGGSEESCLDINVYPPGENPNKNEPFEPDMLTYALSYAAAGYAVFPVHTPSETGGCSCAAGGPCKAKGGPKPGKHPRTMNGVKDGTRDEATIRKWWGWWPDSNIGLATGAPSGADALDIDPAHGGSESVAELIENYGDLPVTSEAETGGGGYHILFKHDPARTFKNSVSVLGKGLDVKTTGGYIIVAPSLHTSGKRYGWRSLVEIAPWPEWLVELMTKQPERKPYAPRDGATADFNPDGPPITGGSRNRKMFEIGCALWAQAVSANDIEDLYDKLMQIYPRCEVIPEKPFESEEVRAIAESIGRLYDYGTSAQEPSGKEEAEALHRRMFGASHSYCSEVCCRDKAA
jgi:hypothetical protein